MFRVKIVFSDGDEYVEDEEFGSAQEAYDHGCYLEGCGILGQEILHISNPSEYPAPDYNEKTRIVVTELA